jgi:integrase/recombinase XerD
MLTTYRRHNPAKCKFTSRSEYRCKCPIWVTGTAQHDGQLFGKTARLGQFVRMPTKLRDWNRVQELVRKWDVDGELPKKRERVTIEDWKTKFLAVAEADNLSTETIRKYKLLFKQMEEFARNKGLRYADQLDLVLLDEFRATWKDGPLSAGKKIERLRSIFKFGVKRGFIEKNVAEDMTTPEVKSNPTLPFSDKEMEAILKAATDARTNTFIQVMRHSGLRISDVTTLATSSLDGRRLSLHQAKTGQPVSILLAKPVADGLRRVEHHNPQYFFWSGTSKVQAAVSVWRKRLSTVFTDAKIKDGHSHRFRDTFAVALLTSGVSLESVSQLLGHQSIKITQRHYAPWAKARQDALDKELEKALQA